MKGQKMDSRGIEPRTTPMLRGYYTTKPQAQLLNADIPICLLPRVYLFLGPKQPDSFFGNIRDKICQAGLSRLGRIGFPGL